MATAHIATRVPEADLPTDDDDATATGPAFIRVNGIPLERCGVIGKGKFGIVEKLRTPDNRVELALKCTLVKGQSDVETQQAQREVDILKYVQSLGGHENILRLHAYFVRSDTRGAPIHVMITELAPYTDLFEVLQAQGGFCLSHPEVKSVVRQVGTALEFLHIRGIVHRDLKLENIFVGNNNVYKLGDFGFASLCAPDKEECRSYCGTPHYMAPELFRDPTTTPHDQRTPYGQRIDMWSMGVILYETLTGMPPFDDQFGHRTMINRIKRGSYAKSSLTTAGASPDAIDLVQKLLVLNPFDRLTATEVLAHKFLCLQ